MNVQTHNFFRPKKYSSLFCKEDGSARKRPARVKPLSHMVPRVGPPLYPSVTALTLSWE